MTLTSNFIIDKDQPWHSKIQRDESLAILSPGDPNCSTCSMVNRHTKNVILTEISFGNEIFKKYTIDSKEEFSWALENLQFETLSSLLPQVDIIKRYPYYIQMDFSYSPCTDPAISPSEFYRQNVMRLNRLYSIVDKQNMFASK